jgi:hypothetical protein
MPSALSRLTPGSHWPDYQGGSLLNLVSRLSRELGGPTSEQAGLHQPWLSGIGQHQQVVLVLIDGLGEQQLHALGPDSMLQRNQRSTLSSVFPATTAAAITTLLTGQPPARHGLIGWHLHCQTTQDGQDSIVAPLPMSVRYPDGSTLRPEQLAGQLLVCPPLLPRLGRPAHILQPHYIADSPYSLHHAGGIQRTAYRDVEDAFAQLTSSLQQNHTPTFHYLYLPQLDSLMHRQGCHSPAVQSLFKQLDAGFSQLVDAADQTDTAIVVTADHGFINTPRTRLISLDEDFPALYAMLAQPLSGERRTVFCHVKPGLKDDFMREAQKQLGDACWVLDSRLLLEAGAFGPGQPHPQLANRCGDVTLLARDDWSIRDTLPQEKPLHLPGQHGGVSAAEMRVPLILHLPRMA